METNPDAILLHDQSIAPMHYYKKLGNSIPLR